MSFHFSYRLRISIGTRPEESSLSACRCSSIRHRRLGRTRGQRLVRLRGVEAIASTRKFDRHGDWHYFTQMPRLLWRLLREPGAINEFARHYWYEGR